MNISNQVGLFSKNLCDIDRLRNNWGWLLFLGILFVALGIVSIGASTVVTLISVEFIGVLLLISGIAQFIYAFWAREWSGFFLSLLAGILYGVTGALLLANPLAAALSLTLLLAAFYMVGGIFRVIITCMARFEQWGWALFSGIIKFILGFLIWQGWPATGLWVFGLFIGIDFIIFGWFWIALALTAKAKR